MQQPTITSFAELKRPTHPPKCDRTKPRSFGFSLLRNKSAQTTSVDHQTNVSRTHSFLSVSLGQMKNATLPPNISSQRRSPSPKLYPAPPVPTAAKLNHAKSKSCNSPEVTKGQLKNDKSIGDINDNANPIQFKLISTEGNIGSYK